MVDPKVVEAVLNEPWESDDWELCVDDERIADFWPGEQTKQNAFRERARQAALGHRALKLLTQLGDFTGLAIGDAAEAEAIIRELRGES